MQIVFLGGGEHEAHRERQQQQQRHADQRRAGDAHHDLPPNRPCGRMKITTMKNRKAIA